VDRHLADGVGDADWREMLRDDDDDDGGGGTALLYVPNNASSFLVVTSLGVSKCGVKNGIFSTICLRRIVVTLS